MANTSEEVEAQVAAEATKETDQEIKEADTDAAAAETPAEIADEKSTEVKDNTPAEIADEKSTEVQANTQADVTDSATDIETKSDNEKATPLELKIIRQVEYYFGDANLNRDKFLQEQIWNNDGGFVPLTVLLTFKRLAELTTDSEVVVTALQKSNTGLVEFSEDRKGIRRHPERPIPERNEEVRKEIQSRTAYAKGFPLDITMAELLEFFAEHKAVNLVMRKYHDFPTKKYKFKGSVFVTFENKEAAEEFINKDDVAYKERKLITKWQDIYIKEKRAELDEKHKKRENKKHKKTITEEKFQLPKGTVIYFEGASEDSSREKIREAVEKIEGEWDIAYIEYSKGNKDGHIRFQKNDIASQFIEKLGTNKLPLKDEVELNLRILEGEEETKFLDNVLQQIKNRRSFSRKGGNRGNKRRHFQNDRNDRKRAKIENE